MGGDATVVFDGWVTRRTLDFVVDVKASGRPLQSVAPRGEYFCLVRNGNKTSMRLFAAEPSSQSALTASVAELAKDPSVLLNAVIDVTLVMRLGQDRANAFLVLTAERTHEFSEHQEGGVAVVNGMVQALRDAQLILSNRGAQEAALSSLRRSLSRRLSAPRRGGAVTKDGRRRNEIVSMKSPPGSIAKRELRSLQDVLSSPQYRKEFREYLKFAFAEENLEFFEAVERFEALSSDLQEERAILFEAICKQFVEESSEAQVNLPSSANRALIDVLDKLRSDSTTVLDKDLFDVAKKEIVLLMDRNFYHGFVVQVQQREMRENMVKEMAGSFTDVWRKSSLEGYVKLVNSFLPEVERIQALHDFVAASVSQLNDQIATLQGMSSKFPVLVAPGRGAALVKPRTLEKIIVQLFSGINQRVVVLMELSRDLSRFCLLPIRELQARVAASVEDIRAAQKPALDEINKARVMLKDSILEENAAFREKQGATLKKKGKKQQAQQAQLEKNLARATAEREGLELKVIEAEHKHEDTILNACEMLESLALYRLETLGEILTQLAMAHRAAHSKAEIGVQSLLFDCLDMDPIGEVIDMATAAKASAGGRVQSLVKSGGR